MSWFEQVRTPSYFDPYHFSSSGSVGGLAELLAKQRLQNDPRYIASQALQHDLPQVMKAYQGIQADKIAQQMLDQQSNYDREYGSGDAASNYNTPTQSELIARSLNDSGANPSAAYNAWKSASADAIQRDLDQQKLIALQQANNEPAAQGDQTYPITMPDGSTINADAKTAYNYWYGGGPQSSANKWAGGIEIASGLDQSGNYQDDGKGQYSKIQLPDHPNPMVVPTDAFRGITQGEAPPVRSDNPSQHNPSPQDQQALDWARSHPDDPRSKLILQRLGML
jgi:hypothetical protein